MVLGVETGRNRFTRWLRDNSLDPHLTLNLLASELLRL